VASNTVGDPFWGTKSRKLHFLSTDVSKKESGSYESFKPPALESRECQRVDALDLLALGSGRDGSDSGRGRGQCRESEDQGQSCAHSRGCHGRQPLLQSTTQRPVTRLCLSFCVILTKCRFRCRCGAGVAC